MPVLPVLKHTPALRACAPSSMPLYLFGASLCLQANARKNREAQKALSIQKILEQNEADGLIYEDYNYA